MFTHTITDDILQDLIKAEVVSENQDYLEEKYAYRPLLGIAMYENDEATVSVELNLGEYGAEYFLCMKNPFDGEWNDVGYVTDLVVGGDDLTDRDCWTFVNVDFEDDDWEKQLMFEMSAVLHKICGMLDGCFIMSKDIMRAIKEAKRERDY